MRSKFSLLGLAMGGMLLLGAEAGATTVTYTTVGKFAAPATPPVAGDNVFNGPGVKITYNSPTGGPQTVDASPTTNAAFGFFDTTGTTATSPVSISTPFTLQIFQALVDGVPAVAGPLNFVGAISGTLQINSSGASLQFSGPLSQQLPPGILYSIVNADDMVAGKIIIAPPNTNNGVTSIQGRITVNVIPEPSAVVLMGMGAVAPLALLLRRRLKARAAA